MSKLIVVPFLRKFLVRATLGTILGLVITLMASQVDQYIYRRRAEHLLGDIQELQLRRTTWQEARDELHRWSAETKVDDQCNQAECSLQITLFEPVYRFAFQNLIFVRIDDYVRWRLKLSYDEGPFVRLELALLRGYMVLGGRPARVSASVGMRDGVLSAKGFSIAIETYWHKIPELFAGGWGEFTLMATVKSLPNLKAPFVNSADPQLVLHPTYYVGRPGGCEICVMGYAHFTPDADPNDVLRLMHFDLSCLTRLRPCLEQADIIPVAWKQYLAEHARE